MKSKHISGYGVTSFEDRDVYKEVCKNLLNAINFNNKSKFC